MATGMSRIAFLAALGKVSVVEPMLINAYACMEEDIWRSGEGESPHGQPWHTSFHASEFPGDDPYACGRKAVYGLLGPPPAEPISPSLRAWFDIGKNLELDWIRRMAYYGVLLSADQTADDEHQTSFEDRSHWLTGSSDAIVLPPHWVKSHCIEVKTTKHEKVQAMLQGELPPASHEKYRRQLRAYIGLAYESAYSPTVLVCQESGLQMIPAIEGCRERNGHKCNPMILRVQPPDDGTLIYSSREEPLVTASFYETYDPDFMAAGRAKLALWQTAFVENRIPPHPRESEKAKWSVDPCQYCDLKRDVCKPDYTKKVATLTESHLAEYAKSIRPDYDFDARRAAVLARWMSQEEVAAA